MKVPGAHPVSPARRALLSARTDFDFTIQTTKGQSRECIFIIELIQSTVEGNELIDDVNLEKVFSLHILSLVKTNEKKSEPPSTKPTFTQTFIQ